MIRVMHLIGDLKFGGAQRSLIRLLEGLPAEFRCDLVTWRDRADDQALRSQVPESVNVWHLPKDGLRDPTWIWRLVSVVRQSEPDLLHGWLNPASHWAVAASKAAHRPPVITSEMTLREPASRRMIHRLSAAAVADSEAVFGRLPKRRRVLIRPGVPNRCEGPMADLPGRVVLCVASLHPDKGVDLLLEHARRSSDQIVVVGPTIDHDYARQLRADAPPNMTFTGGVQDVTPYLRRADVFVLPSRTESCPNALLEAMTYGIRVVATTVGDVPNVTANYDATLVHPDDASALSDGIEAAASTPRPMPANRFGVDDMVRQYVELYRRVLR
ncbi:MAG: glycosyltransferase involved in cell wall biosynthesis [Myxococcota bacterium]|jgi:glycosyltransferase involved in cell wall biosynthesis